MSASAYLTLTLASASLVFGQFPGLTLPYSGDNQKASVTQFIGPVKVSIEYSSPKVHAPDGTDRRGKIWGKLVPYGLTNLGFGNGKPGPWRGGANENTVFEVSHPVSVEGQPLAAGRYGLHFIAGADEWTIVFSKNSTSWGSFFYEDSEDALRLKAKPRKNDYHEWLTYEFTSRRPTSATVELRWEDLALPWTIKVEKIEDLYISRLREDLRTTPGFSWQGWVNAAQYCVTANTHLEQALEWADVAINRSFVGQTNFTTLNMKGQVLAKLGRDGEAKTIMSQALRHPTATPAGIHQYGRQLLTSGKTAEAFEVFKLNAERHGDAWPVHVGLARGYAATGDTQKALEHAKKAVEQAPDPLNRTNLENMVKALSQGQKFTN